VEGAIVKVGMYVGIIEGLLRDGLLVGSILGPGLFNVSFMGISDGTIESEEGIEEDGSNVELGDSAIGAIVGTKVSTSFNASDDNAFGAISSNTLSRS
jgi:hypothetical protein